MSYIYAQAWMVGAPKCASASCPHHILDYNQAVVVVSNAGGTVGFCSARCLQEALTVAPVPQEPGEATSERDLLQTLGYCSPCGGSDSA